MHLVQGEEIGMIDQWLSWNDTVDPAACNTNPSTYEHFTRDPERTPFQWSDEKNAGFSNSNKTWLPVANNFKTVNVKVEQSSSTNSHLQIYKNFQQLRQTDTMKYGDVVSKALNDQVLVIYRELQGHVAYITMVNVGPYTETVSLKEFFPQVSDNLVYLIVSCTSTHRFGWVSIGLWTIQNINIISLIGADLISSEQVPSDKIVLEPKEGFVVQTTGPIEESSMNVYYEYNSFI